MPILVFFFIAASLALGGWLAVNVSFNYLLAFIAGIFTVVFAFFYPTQSIIFLIFSMLLSPEIKVGGVTGRSVVLRYDDIFLVMIFFSWLARTAIFKHKSSFVKSPITKPLLFYTLIYITSTSLGVLRADIDYKKAFLYVLKYIEYYMLYFMSINTLKDEVDFSKYLKYAWLVLIAVICYSYYYYFNSSGPDVRASAPFEAPLNSPKESEPASLGGYYIIAFSLLLAFSSEASGRYFLLSIMSLMFMYQSLLYTFSRASYMGFIASFISFVLFSKSKKIFFILAATLAMIFTITLPGTSEKVENRIRSTYSGTQAIYSVSTVFGEIKLEESAYLRYYSIINVVNNVFPYYPLLGKGVTGIGLGDNQYALIVGETGILGTMAFLWLIVSLFKVYTYLYKNGKDIISKTLGLGLTCALSGLLMQGVGVNTFIIVRIMEPFWFLNAIATLMYIRIKEI